MKERPIIFNSEMVRAILDGRKTQTRRVVKCPPRGAFVMCGPHDVDDDGGWWPYESDDGEFFVLNDGTEKPMRCPYGAPGDRLWVRETWHPAARFGTEYLIEYRADESERIIDVGWDGPTPELDAAIERQAWKPSIHMPRWASRIQLEVTNVRVERVQDISAEDAIAEGVDIPRCTCDACHKTSAICPADASEAVMTFRGLWDSINAERGHGWEANPWVWVVEFKLIEVAK